MKAFNYFLCKVAEISFRILSLYSSLLTNFFRNRIVPVLCDSFCRIALLFSTHHAALYLSFQQDHLKKLPNIRSQLLRLQINNISLYEGWNFNSGYYLFTTDTK